MNNTFKYIAALVAFSAAALMSGLTANAQNLEEGTYIEENGVAYSKSATLENGTNNKYDIDVKTFVTGSITVENEAIPADIVLVLDVSGSMSDNMTSYTYTVASVSSLNGNSSGTWRNDRKSTTYYYQYHDRYFQVYIGRAARWGGYYYYLTFTDNYNNTLYIDTSGQVVENRPSNVTSANTNLLASSVTLYNRSTGSTTQKLAALKTAVLSFIDIIDQNDLDNAPEGQTRLGNRLAIVTYSSDSTTRASLTPLSNKSSLVSIVNGLNANGGTNAHLGMGAALKLLNNSSSHLKTTVMFTDGNPGLYGDWTGNNRQGTWDSANGTISTAAQIKSLAVESEDPDEVVYSKVYTVGVFTDPSDYTNVYMGKTSSNYKKDATSMGSYNTWSQVDIWSNGNGTALAEADQNFSFNATSADELNEIFESIAHASGGTENTDLSGGSAVTVDIVSSSFTAPKNATDVTVLVAPCTGKTTIGGKEYLTFGEAKAPSEYGLPNITADTDPETNAVFTTGFDFSANWCGPDQSSTTGYHGFQQILRFTITVNDDAVGGPHVETNDEESGIYLDGSDEPLIKFNRPYVKIPVQIWIQKAGLQGEDSAVFTLARAPFTPDFDPATAEWESVTKIVVGPEDLDSATGLYIKKQVGLDPDYYYRIKEDAWAFGYQYQYGGTLYTVGDEVVNPFKFENTPKNKKFDEAQARNIFNEKPAEQSK